MSFCPTCGGALAAREVEGRLRDVCSQCGRIHYRQLKVGAGAIIEQDGRLLLLQRSHPPFAGCWNLPAGYAEADEDPRHTVVREVTEETGLLVEVVRLEDVYYFDDDPRGNGVLIVFRCRVVGGALRPSDEATVAHAFARDEVPASLAGGGHDRAVRAWAAL